ncbi:MAG: sulfatase/phosphatase domain-containing protein, partial [Verrucomicrobiota bacterium]
IYLSDIGPKSWRWNGGMKGKNGSTVEGGVRTPFVMSWPGRIKAGTRIDRIASHIDLLPTLADLADIDLIETKPFDGVSLKPLLEGKTRRWPDRMIFSSQRNVSVRSQRYRADAKGLYDMEKDPGQRTNIAQREPKLHREFLEAMAAWEADVGDWKMGPYGKADRSRPYPVGHPEFPLTVLHAQDAWIFEDEPEVRMRFSSRHPNASWLTDWGTEGAYPVWDVDIATSGKYEVVVMYTCPEEELGSVVTFNFKDRSRKRTVKEAYHPPLFASPDRVERVESYDKPFKVLNFGLIGLPPGRGDLYLEATHLNNTRVMDLRSVHLRLVE